MDKKAFYDMDIGLEGMIDLAQHVAADVWGPRDPKKMMEKLKEEVDELEEAIHFNPYQPAELFEVMKEFGDVMFCIFRLADNIGIDPTSALALSIVKIQERDKFNVANRKVPKDEG